MVERKKENGDIIITNGAQTLKVGDYINYDANSNGEQTYTAYADKTGMENDQSFSTTFNTDGWRLLDIDYSSDGEHLIIIPKNFIKTTENKAFGLRELQDSGVLSKAYQYGVDEIKNICQIYGKGKKALYARSIEIEDINRLTGYNPLKTGDGTVYGQGTEYEYMQTVTVKSQGYFRTIYL